MKRTHFKVQTTSTLFVHVEREPLCYCEKVGAEGAAELSISEARRLCREYGAKSEERGKRFPRILKTTIETTTVKG